MSDATLNQNDQNNRIATAAASKPGPVRMGSNAPAQKVTAATLAAAVVQVLIWLNNSGSGPQIPADVAVALTAIATFAAGYLTPPGSKEEVVPYNDPRRSSAASSATR